MIIKIEILKPSYSSNRTADDGLLKKRVYIHVCKIQLRNIMKQIYFFLVVLSASFVFGQGGVKIVHASDFNTDISGTEVEAVGDPSDARIYYDMRVINLTGTSQDIRYERKRIANSGRTDEVCDEMLCHTADDATWFQTPNTVTVDHEDTTVLKPQIAPGNMESCGIHKYYVVSNGTYLDSITIKFRTTNSNCFLSVEDESNINSAFNLYPNPAENELTIENLTNFDSDILIHDALGKEIALIHVTGSTQQINLSDLKSGIYFVSLRNEQGTLTEPKKLIVKK